MKLEIEVSMEDAFFYTELESFFNECKRKSPENTRIQLLENIRTCKVKKISEACMNKLKEMDEKQNEIVEFQSCLAS